MGISGHGVCGYVCVFVRESRCSMGKIRGQREVNENFGGRTRREIVS